MINKYIQFQKSKINIKFIINQEKPFISILNIFLYKFSLTKDNLKTSQLFTVTTNTGITFQAKSRLDTDVEIEYFKHGGILQYVTRKHAAQQL